MQSQGDRVRPIFDGKLADNVLHVNADGTNADSEFRADLPINHTVRCPVENVALTSSKGESDFLNNNLLGSSTGQDVSIHRITASLPWM